MAVAFCQYARFIDATGATPAYGYYQNFYINKTSAYASNTYAFLPFSIGAGIGESGGDRPFTTFVCPRNDISMNIITEAVDGFWSLRVDTVMVDADTLAAIGLFLSEKWVCNGYEQSDSEDRILTMQLSSPFDAIDTQIPPLLLTEARVGSVPSSGAINVG